MKTIRVCHVTSVHPWNDARIFHKECISLVQSGYHVFLVAYDVSEVVVAGVHLINAGRKPASRVMRIFLSWYRFAKIMKKLDPHIIHIHDPELLPVGFIFRKSGRKLIFDIHENIPDQIMLKRYIPSLLRRFVSYIYKFLERKFLRYFDYCVAAVPFIRMDYEKRGYKVVEVQNFPRVEEFALIEHNWNEKGRAICYVGLLDQSRGANILLKLMDRMPDWTLYIAGTVTDKFLLDTIKKHPSIHYLGVLRRTELPMLFSKCVAGLVLFEPLPKYEVSLPIKMFEYMAAGLPVVATGFDYWKQFLYYDDGSRAGILVNVQNMDEVIKSIQHLWENRAVSMWMGQAGRKAVQQMFHWKMEERKLLQVYSKLCETYV